MDDFSRHLCASSLSLRTAAVYALSLAEQVVQILSCLTASSSRDVRLNSGGIALPHLSVHCCTTMKSLECNQGRY
jgi:hypothetical protein